MIKLCYKRKIALIYLYWTQANLTLQGQQLFLKIILLLKDQNITQLSP
jgi:hypothetical protein